MNCYTSNRKIKKLDLIIAETNEFNLTEGKVYVVLSNSVPDHLVYIENDEGVVDSYTTEHFRFYDGELVS